MCTWKTQIDVLGPLLSLVIHPCFLLLLYIANILDHSTLQHGDPRVWHLNNTKGENQERLQFRIRLHRSKDLTSHVGVSTNFTRRDCQTTKHFHREPVLFFSLTERLARSFSKHDSFSEILHNIKLVKLAMMHANGDWLALTIYSLWTLQTIGEKAKYPNRPQKVIHCPDYEAGILKNRVNLCRSGANILSNDFWTVGFWRTNTFVDVGFPAVPNLVIWSVFCLFDDGFKLLQ